MRETGARSEDGFSKQAALELQHRHVLDRGHSIGRSDNGTEMTDNLAGDVETLERVTMPLKQDRIVAQLVANGFEQPPRMVDFFGDPLVQLTACDRERRWGSFDEQRVTTA